MADDLKALEDWAAPLLAALSTQQRRALARTVGQALRRSQAKRIAAQKAPDGTLYAPRKQLQLRAQGGRIRRGMFEKLRLIRHFKVIPEDEGVSVGFLGRTGRIARVHQEGMRDQVEPGGPSVVYPRRVLLGLTQEDRDLIRDLLIRHLLP